MKKILGLGGVTTDQIGVVDHIPSSDEVIRLQEYRLQQGGMVATARRSLGVTLWSRISSSRRFLDGHSC